MIKRTWKYPTVLTTALVGLALVGVGLWLAALSDPSRFSDNVQNDRIIDAYAGGGLLCGVIGVALFLFAVRHEATSLSPENKQKINASIGSGLVLQLVGIPLIQLGLGQSGLGWLLVLASLPLFVLGAIYYAAAKGYSQQLGLLGVLGAFGLIVLILLPNRNTTSLDLSEPRETSS